MIEKRHYPRINISAPVLVKLKNGESVTVDLDNISSSGLQLLCNHEAESLITPRGQWDPEEMMISIELPGLKAELKFEAKCVIVTSRRVAIDKFNIGLKFVDFIGASYESLGKSLELQANL